MSNNDKVKWYKAILEVVTYGARSVVDAEIDRLVTDYSEDKEVAIRWVSVKEMKEVDDVSKV